MTEKEVPTLTKHQALMVMGSILEKDTNGTLKLFGVPTLEWSQSMWRIQPTHKEELRITGVSGASGCAKFLRALADKLDEAETLSRNSKGFGVGYES